MRLRIPVAAAIVLAALAFSPIAFAGTDPNWKGWFVNLDGAMANPGNVNTPLINSGPSDSAASGGGDISNEVEYSDFGGDGAWSLGVGYSWGKKGSLSVSYWSYSATEDNSGSNDYYPNYNWFTVGPTASFGYTFYYPMKWDFEQEIKASTLDIEYKRSQSWDNPFVLTWGVGLRMASFEDTVDGEYEMTNGAYSYRFPASRKVDGDGFGFTGSVGAEYGFTDRFGLATNLRVGFLTSDIDSDSQITDRDGYYTYPVTGATWSEDRSQNDELATTMDFNFNLSFTIGDHVVLEPGYFYSTWSDLPSVGLSRGNIGTDDQAAPVIQDENRDRISWSGPSLRVKVKW
ncbi:MAG TPA: hypothetical protein VFG76_12715 [Candidatus Polarisedimenticolia bacterium]|nr:hypothetical protein [Candidatus Polarisedimenticolia bacterium]